LMLTGEFAPLEEPADICLGPLWISRDIAAAGDEVLFWDVAEFFSHVVISWHLLFCVYYVTRWQSSLFVQLEKSTSMSYEIYLCLRPTCTFYLVVRSRVIYQPKFGGHGCRAHSFWNLINYFKVLERIK
jgi:hypothetical protein